MSTALGDFLRPSEYAGPHGVRALGREGSVALELVRGDARRRTDRRSGRRAAFARAGRVAALEPVLLVPGFMAGDWSLSGMAGSLRAAGFRTYRSGIRVNARCTMLAADDLERRIEQIAERRGTAVSIVGHSLGGLLARGLATRRPDLVAGIVTMGSPVLAPGAVHATLGWNMHVLNRLNAAGLPWTRGLMGVDCAAGRCAKESWDAVRAPLAPGTGFTAIYSQRDGIVDWRSCLDPAAEHVEVRSSHLGMAVDPAVLDHVVAALRAQQVSRLESGRASSQAAPVGSADRLRVAST